MEQSQRQTHSLQRPAADLEPCVNYEYAQKEPHSRSRRNELGSRNLILRRTLPIGMGSESRDSESRPSDGTNFDTPLDPIYLHVHSCTDTSSRTFSTIDPLTGGSVGKVEANQGFQSVSETVDSCRMPRTVLLFIPATGIKVYFSSASRPILHLLDSMCGTMTTDKLAHLVVIPAAGWWGPLRNSGFIMADDLVGLCPTTTSPRNQSSECSS